VKLTIDPNTLEGYRTFLRVKQLPVYKIRGRVAEFPDEYAERIGLVVDTRHDVPYEPSPFLFDYQAGVADIAIRKRKFGAFIRPGLGKTLIYYEFIRTAMKAMCQEKGALLITPPMVIEQTAEEGERFYGKDFPIEIVKSGNVNKWLETCAGRIGITNYEAFRTAELDKGQLAKLVVDESSMLKSHYGKYGTAIVTLGKQLEWVLCGTGTPAPNDRIEYANHAVMLGQFPTVNSFLAKFFINRGQTQERWELKPHALEPFYRAISHWSILLTNPATYGWKDNCESIPPIHVHIDDVPMTASQHAAVGWQNRSRSWQTLLVVNESAARHPCNVRVHGGSSPPQPLRAASPSLNDCLRNLLRRQPDHLRQVQNVIRRTPALT